MQNSVLWNGEILRARIQFPTGEYIATSSPSTAVDKFLISVEFSLSDGNTAVNPLGVAMSNSASLLIYDTSDNLSPGNTRSPYYGQTVNGVKVLLEISEDNGITWLPYGTWYTVGWSGRYFDGGHDAVQISVEDALNTIGQRDIPQVEAYIDTPANTLIHKVLTKAGIPAEKIYIDPSLTQIISYGVVQGAKLRNFWNSVCQMIFARVQIVRNDTFCFYPALSPLTGGNTWNLTPDELGPLDNRNEQAINYATVEVSYFEPDSLVRDYIFNDTQHSLVAGDNTITDIRPTGKIISVEQVDISSPDFAVNSLQVAAFQDYVSLFVNVSAASDNVQISGIGFMLGSKTSKVSAPIPDSSQYGSGVFTFDSQQVLTAAQAQQLASALTVFVKQVSRSFSVSGTPLTPFIYPGDTVVISGTGTMYDGTYKITGATLRFSEGFDADVKFLRIGG